MVAVDVQSLRELSYEAALADDLWGPLTLRTAEAFGTHGALFWVIDVERGEMLNGNALFRDRDGEAIMREYFAGPVTLDPQMTKVISSAGTEVYTDLDHLDLSDRGTRTYLDWQTRVCGTRHHLTSSIWVSPTIRAGLAVHRSADIGPATPDERAAMEAFTTDFAATIRLGYLHNGALLQSWWDGATHIPGKSALLLDAQGRVVRSTAAAEALLQTGTPIAIRRDRLTGKASDDHQRLEQTVARACRDIDPRAGAVNVRADETGRLWRVIVYPLVKKQRFLAPFTAAAVVYIDDLAKPIGASQHRAHAYNLTKREAQIADGLAAGESLSEIGEALGISRNTVRVHLQALFDKTETRRQADLLRALLAIS